MYRHQRYIYDLTRRYYLIGRDQLIAELNPPPGGSVLEVGCGTARNLLHAARRYPRAKFFGLDVSEEMLKTAQASIDRSPFKGAISVAQADATTFSPTELFGLRDIDRIFISYALSMIPPWQAVVDRAVCAARAERRASHRRFRHDGLDAGASAPRHARLAYPL